MPLHLGAGVGALSNQSEQLAHEACSRLRFAEGLRRRSAQARAESAIREASALALLSGARVPPARLRELTMADPNVAPVDSADEAVAIGAWRATWSLLDSLPPLNERRSAGVSTPARTPLAARLAGWHRDLAASLVDAGLADLGQVTIPRNPQRWQQLRQFLAADTDGSALQRAARAWALLTIESPFAVAGEALGPLYAKWLLAVEGVEPAGVAVISALSNEGPRRAAALEAVRAGDWEPWYDFVAQSVIRGCEIGESLVRQVQAGQTGR